MRRWPPTATSPLSPMAMSCARWPPGGSKRRPPSAADCASTPARSPSWASSAKSASSGAGTAPDTLSAAGVRGSSAALILPTPVARVDWGHEDAYAQTRALGAQEAPQEAQAQARQALAADVLDAAEWTAAAQSEPGRWRRPLGAGRVRPGAGRAVAVARGLRPAPRRHRPAGADG